MRSPPHPSQLYPASELTPGYYLTRSPRTGPIVLASPHSGRAYPAAFVSASLLDIAGLRRAEDAWVDDLAAPAAALGAPLIAARWGRAFIDLNRDPAEIDLSLLTDPGAAGAVRASERVRSGLGVLPRLTGPGLHIYPAKFAAAAALQRIDAVHRPYHHRIAALLDAAVADCGYALLIDCHSMPSLPQGPRQRPHFVIGDAGGTAAPEAVVRWIESHFRCSGFRTARNEPYAGGYTTRSHGSRLRRRFAVQIEIDRSLYMNAETLDRHPGFAEIAGVIETMVAGLLAWLPGRYEAGPRAVAAE